MKDNGFFWKFLLMICLLPAGLLPGNPCDAQRTHFIVDSLTTVLDADYAPYNLVDPGDTILLSGGRKNFLLIRNFQGEPGNPIVFINSNGVVIIDTDHYFGISVENCRYFRITGSGVSSDFYGIRIDRVSRGGGIGIGKLSSDVELDHVSIKNVLFGAIYAKSDPDCLFNSTRDKFTQYNTVIHDNYLEDTGNEGMYIGSSKYFGQTVNCNGTDTLLMPSLLNGVRIYNNIVRSTCWDGIQVSSASHDCRIYDNLVLYDSQAGVFGQMSGILIGGGSKCDCYNNYISGGKGDGIESHGLGGYRIFNNIIEDAGLSFYPDDPYQMKYGIMVTDVSVLQDSSFIIMHNDIIHPKSDGIRFLSINSRNNLVASNAIINPGNFDFYEYGHFSVKGIDSYVMVPDTAADLLIQNNYFTRNADSAGFAGSGYAPLQGSPLVNYGYPDIHGISIDFYHHPRICGGSPDIGAIEYNPQFQSIPDDLTSSPAELKLWPNPVRESLSIRFTVTGRSGIKLNMYDLRGKLIGQKDLGQMDPGVRTQKINVGNLPGGIYLFILMIGDKSFSGKFIKADQ